VGGVPGEASLAVPGPEQRAQGQKRAGGATEAGPGAEGQRCCHWSWNRGHCCWERCCAGAGALAAATGDGVGATAAATAAALAPVLVLALGTLAAATGAGIRGQRPLLQPQALARGAGAGAGALAAATGGLGAWGHGRGCSSQALAPVLVLGRWGIGCCYWRWHRGQRPLLHAAAALALVLALVLGHWPLLLALA